MNSNDDDYRHHVVIDLLDASDDDDEDDTDAVLESIPVPDWERRRTNQSDAPSAPTTSTHHVRANGGEPQRKTCPEKVKKRFEIGEDLFFNEMCCTDGRIRQDPTSGPDHSITNEQQTESHFAQSKDDERIRKVVFLQEEKAFWRRQR